MFNPYIILAALAVFIASIGGSYVKGRVDCAAIHDTANLKAEIASLKKQAADTAAVQQADAARAIESAAQTAALQEKINVLEGAAADSRDCLSGADVDRLRTWWPKPAAPAARHAPAYH
jgi:hypothetical protein